PAAPVLVDDIERGRLYVVERESGICGVFMFELAEDPTYSVIDGEWLDNSPYGVIHRVAARVEEHGVFGEVYAFAREKSDHLRIDTHRDNKVMQKVLDRYGFSPCGIIYLENGDPRIAYEYTKKVPS
ncbi:MAG: N-acetyltransferase, partial [Clostridia bacterium]|nr:N-acetyltransferase [Clostridia bacterium]